MSNAVESVMSEPVQPLTRLDGLVPVSWEDVDPKFHWLANRGYGWQFGEQGILQSVLDTLGLDSGKVFEGGAGDSVSLPLMCQAMVLEGWRALLVEPNTASMTNLQSRMSQLGVKSVTYASEVLCASENMMEGGITVDALFDREHFYPDVMILDINSYEWYILRGMEHRPKVIVAEHHDISDMTNPTDLPPIEECGQRLPNSFLNQAPWVRTKELMESKGYTAVAKTRINGIYVRNDLADMVAEGCKKHKWKKIEKPKCVVVLSQPRLCFSDHAIRIANLCKDMGCEVVHGAGAFWDRDMSLSTELAISKYAPDFLIYSDYDSVFTSEDVTKLLEAINNDPEMGAIGAVQMSRHNDKPLVYDNNTDYSKPVTPVRFQHFGLTIIRRQVFEQIPQPWFWSLPTLDGSWSAPNRSDADITFWRLLHEHQIKVCQHNEVVIGHMILSVKWPSEKGRGVKLQPIEMYNAYGKPADAVFKPELFKPKPE